MTKTSFVNHAQSNARDLVVKLVCQLRFAAITSQQARFHIRELVCSKRLRNAKTFSSPFVQFAFSCPASSATWRSNEHDSQTVSFAIQKFKKLLLSTANVRKPALEAVFDNACACTKFDKKQVLWSQVLAKVEHPCMNTWRAVTGTGERFQGSRVESA